MAYSTASEAFGRLGIAAIKNSAKKPGGRASRCQFRRIRHAQRPECLELAPTAAAQWALRDTTANAAKNHDAKP
jgi:hypothetical protein